MKFEQLYQQYVKLVYNLALQYCQNTQDAEEITQDVFLKVHQKLSTFKHDSNVKTWIYRIAINTSLDFIKSKNSLKRGMYKTANQTDDIPMAYQNFNHPGVELEQKESIQKIFSAINQLNENQKTVIILLKIEQHSTKEVADILNLSPKAVESLFQRAKSNLTNLLNQQKENE
jgi:RNA polymerase sigma factor (sigma-70 family)